MESQSNQSPPSDHIIDLIRKCLALSSSPNEHEAALALSKAQELLEKYNLSMAQVSAEETSDHTSGVVEGEISYEGEDWIRRLYHIVAKHNFCKTVGRPSSGKISIIGRFVNIQASVEMSLWIKEQIESITVKEMSHISKYSIDESGFYTGRTTNKRVYRASFLLGIVIRLGERLKAMSEERKVVTPNLRALTINLLQESDIKLRQLYPHLIAGTYGVAKNAEAFYKGKSAANGIGLVRPSHHVGEGGSLRLGVGK